jgi:hypothetical protein
MGFRVPAEPMSAGEAAEGTEREGGREACGSLIPSSLIGEGGKYNPTI